MKQTEYVILVDANDKAIGQEEKIKAHQLAQLHRAFSVFIINDKHEVLMQQRNPEKYHCGGLWTNTCCGHPRPNETTQGAAERRLNEETGIQTQLSEIGHFTYQAAFDNGLTENEFDHVLLQTLNQPTLQINPDEISDYRWQSINHLTSELEKQPQLYTPWLLPALEILRNTLLINA